MKSHGYTRCKWAIESDGYVPNSDKQGSVEYFPLFHIFALLQILPFLGVSLPAHLPYFHLAPSFATLVQDPRVI